jgi:hypothetical protein
VFAALLLVVVGAIAGATGSRLIQYGVIGAATEVAVTLIAVHSFLEAALRPARAALAGDTGIGDDLPRSRPTFAAWSNLSVLSVAFGFTVAGAILAAVFDRVAEVPVLVVVFGFAMTVGFAMPLTVGANFSPSLQPIRDLAAAPNGLRPVTTASACRWCRTMTSVRWRRRSTACRPVWLSGNDFWRRSEPTSIQPLLHGCSSRVTMCSPVSAAR